MIKIGTVEQGTPVEINIDRFVGTRIEMFESAEGAPSEPQAFLVRQQANFVLTTHFHRQEQFQVVVAGAGTLASHLLRTVTVHYSSPEAGYGPITAGPEGLDYLTLRRVSEQGAFYLPDQRDAMQRGLHKHHVTVSHVPRGAGNDLAFALGAQPHTEVMIEPNASGLAAWCTAVGAGMTAPLPKPFAGSGRFYVVVGGNFDLNGTRLAHASAVFASTDEHALCFIATDGLAELLTLQFPG